MQRIYTLLTLTILISFSTLFLSCGKDKNEDVTFTPPRQENLEDQKSRDEFERLKQMKSQNETDTVSFSDTSSLTNEQKIDTASVKKEEKKEEQKVEKKKEMVKIEKELNKNTDNPTETINDYMEYLKRGIGNSGSFESNMQKASDLWESRSTGAFKSYYKNTKKMAVLSEPKVISQKGNSAVVEVKVKKIDEVDGKEKETVMIVRYNLSTDSKGKWKIKGNTVKTN